MPSMDISRVMPPAIPEIVFPLQVNNQIIGVLDIDSTAFSRFTAEDEQGLAELVAHLENSFLRLTIKNIRPSSQDNQRIT